MLKVCIQIFLRNISNKFKKTFTFLDLMHIDIMKDYCLLILPERRQYLGMSVNLKKERYKIKDLIGKEKEHVIIEDTEKIPEGQPEAEAVIDVEPTAKVEDIKLINDRVIVEGVLDVRVFYTESEFEDSDEENQVFIFHFAPEPFTAFIDIPGVQSDMKADIKISVSGINVDIIESNLLRKQADLDITALVFQKKDLELPVKAIREQIASAVDLIVHQSRLRGGERKITQVSEVQGMEGEVIVMQDIFTFSQEGVDENGKVVGQFQSTGIKPKFMDKLEAQGFQLPPETFMPAFR